MSSKPGLLYIRIVSCHDLRKADLLTQNDTYVVTTFRGQSWKTSVVPNTALPSWKNELRIFSFMVEDDGKHDVIEFTIKEKDVLLRDETLHHVTFPVSRLATDQLNHVRLDNLTFEACLGNFVFLPLDAVEGGIGGAAVKLFTDCQPDELVAT